MAASLRERVRGSLAALGLFRPDKLLVVAVSGGPDSLCLLHLLAELRAESGPRLHLAHLDHGFRGAESAADAHFVAATAAAWGVEASIALRDVPAQARAGRLNGQAAARQARYSFLADVAIAVKADAVVVAHHADDQAETVLLHAMRGAGLAGLRGMRPAVGWQAWTSRGERGALLIRPLLTSTRAEIAAYCVAQALHARDDPSNRAEHYARSRVRNSLLPAMAAHNPQIVAALGRTAQLCADEHDLLQHLLDAYWPALVEDQVGTLLLRLERWAELHPALQRLALRRAAAQLLAGVELSYPQIEAARAAMAAGPGRRLQLGRGLWLEVDYNRARVGLGSETLPNGDEPQLGAEPVSLAIPGCTAIGAGWSCLAQVAPPNAPSRWWVGLDAIQSRLELRRRRPGDRFRPAGGLGSRSLQDFFVDRKLPRALRDGWPILVAGEAIVWVAGLRADERFLAAPGAQAVIWVGLVRDV